MSEGAPLGGATAETGRAVRAPYRIRLPAIFAAFFWLGVTSFGGNTAAWVYHRIVQRRHWVTNAEFLSGLALGRTFATGLKLRPSGSARFGPLAVAFATVLCVGVLRWPMLPVVLCLAPLSIGLALVQRRNV